MRHPRSLVLLALGLVGTACGPDAPTAPSAEASLDAATPAALVADIDVASIRVDRPTLRLERSFAPAPGATVLVEDFSDPFGAWRTRFMGLHSNLENYYIATNSCWGPVSGGECRGNNWDGIWIHDGDGSSPTSSIRFDAEFAASLVHFSMDVGAHGGSHLRVFDADMAVILDAPVPWGCSNCSQGNPGGNIYHGFSVSSTNGIGGFDLVNAEGNTGVDNIVVHQLTTITVDLDIKPGSADNSVNPRAKGVIPVAVLTTDDFDAAAVDVATLAFGPGGAAEAHGRGHAEDVDGDGDVDLVLHFDTGATGVACGDASLSLTGQTLDGTDIEGSDAIVTKGCK